MPYSIDFSGIVFYVASGALLTSAAVVALSRNIVHSAFALLGTFAGVAILFLLLSADFVAMVQVVIYIGGILILFLFAVMLTSSIGTSKITNRSKGIVGALAVMLGSSLLLLWLIHSGVFTKPAVAHGAPTALPIGDALLGPYVLPFEIISVLLLLALVGAVILARREVQP